MSHPTSHSVNDGISAKLCTLQYASVDMAIDMVRRLGRGTQLVKLDIKDAYRIIPVGRWQRQLCQLCGLR